MPTMNVTGQCHDIINLSRYNKLDNLVTILPSISLIQTVLCYFEFDWSLNKSM